MKSQASKSHIYHTLGEKKTSFVPFTLQLGDFNLKSMCVFAS